MKKFDRDLIQETIDEMGLTITFDNEESGFIDDNETLEEIEEQCRDVAFQTIDWGYEEINEEVR